MKLAVQQAHIFAKASGNTCTSGNSEVVHVQAADYLGMEDFVDACVDEIDNMIGQMDAKAHSVENNSISSITFVTKHTMLS